MPDSEFTILRLPDDPLVYRLKYDFNEIADAELATGCNLLRAFSPGGMGARELRGVLYAMLRADCPKVTLSEAGELLSRDTVLCLKAVKQCAGEESEPEPDVPAAPVAAEVQPAA